jgi:dUTP pyrophosphatase
VELRFQRLTEAARLPTRAHDGDAGLDLYAAEAATVPPAGGRIDIGTGVAVEIPEGHAGLVLPRSGSARKHGITLTNAPGLIDSGYRGELRALILNTDPTEAFEISPGDRIAQLVIVAVELPTPVEVDDLGESERGERGFGSSGFG